MVVHRERVELGGYVKNQHPYAVGLLIPLNRLSTRDKFFKATGHKEYRVIDFKVKVLGVEIEAPDGSVIVSDGENRYSTMSMSLMIMISDTSLRILKSLVHHFQLKFLIRLSLSKMM
jgi:hypothetical protein